jgi:TonB family protein
MNRNFMLSSFISIGCHAALFFSPAGYRLYRDIDLDLIKAPASIEISMVRSAPPVKIEKEKISAEDQVHLPAEKKAEIPQPPEKAYPPEPVAGAITEQISTLMSNAPPRYPTLTRIKGWEGEVILIAQVYESGAVESVRVLESSGYHILDESAVRAVSRWRFRNITGPAQIKIPVKFVLTGTL